MNSYIGLNEFFCFFFQEEVLKCSIITTDVHSYILIARSKYKHGNRAKNETISSFESEIQISDLRRN